MIFRPMYDGKSYFFKLSVGFPIRRSSLKDKKFLLEPLFFFFFKRAAPHPSLASSKRVTELRPCTPFLSCVRDNTLANCEAHKEMSS